LPVACASPAGHPGGPPALERARSALDAGEEQSARELLEAWLSENPGAPAARRSAALQLLVHACALLCDPEASLAYAEAALDLAPDDPWLHYARGVALEETGALAAAVAAFGRALALHPRHLKSAQWRGHVLGLLGEHEAAVQDWTLALEILATARPEELRGWGGEPLALERDVLLERAASFDALGEHEAAERDRERARALALRRRRSGRRRRSADGAPPSSRPRRDPSELTGFRVGLDNTEQN
jgi:tetratricopeptide (TPR) repeat protein